MAQLMPLPLTVSCFSKIQSGFTFLVLAHLGSPGKRAVKWVLYNFVVPTVVQQLRRFRSTLLYSGWLGSRVVSVLGSNCSCDAVG